MDIEFQKLCKIDSKRMNTREIYEDMAFRYVIGEISKEQLCQLAKSQEIVHNEYKNNVKLA